MDEMERKVIEIEQRGKSNTHRIDDLERKNDAVQELATSVKLMAQSMERMTAEQQKQGERLDALERMPGEQWSTLKRTVFTSAVSTISGGLLGAILAMLIR